MDLFCYELCFRLMDGDKIYNHLIVMLSQIYLRKLFVHNMYNAAFTNKFKSPLNIFMWIVGLKLNYFIQPINNLNDSEVCRKMEYYVNINL